MPNFLRTLNFDGQDFRPSITRADRQDFGGVSVPISTLLAATIDASDIMFGEEIFRPIPQKTMLASIRTWLDDHLLQVNASMPPLAKFPTVKARGSRIKVELERFAIASELDWHFEAKHLESIRAAGGNAAFEETFATYQLAQMIRDMWMEVLRAKMILDPANHLATNVRTLAPGSEWNSPAGSARADSIAAAARLRLGAPGFKPKKHMLACLPDNAHDTLVEDDSLWGANEARVPPDEEETARRLGAGRAVIGDTATKKELDSEVELLYNDSVIYKVDHKNPPRPIVLPNNTNIYDGVVHLRDSGRGVAMDPKHVHGTTSEYPVAGFDALALINPRVLYMVRNTNKNS